MRNILAVIGALLLMTCTVPYLVDIVHHRTKPNIVTWFTWTLLALIASGASFAAHQPQSALLPLGDAIGTGLVVILGLRYGITKFSLFDVLCQGGAVLGLIAWLVFNSPIIGIMVPILIDAIASLPTFKHAWQKPREETWQTFFIGFIGCCFTIFALPRLWSVGLIYPLYLLLSNGSLGLVITERRRA